MSRSQGDTTLEAFPPVTPPGIELTQTKQASLASARYQQPPPPFEEQPFADATPPPPFQETRHSSVSTATSLGRRLSKTFQESDLPRGFLGATAELTSSMYAAAQTRSGTRTRRSSTVATVTNDPEALNRGLQEQRTQSRENTLSNNLSTLQEQRLSSTSFSNEDRKNATVLANAQEEDIAPGDKRGGFTAGTVAAGAAAGAAAAGNIAPGSAGTAGGAASASNGSGEVVNNGALYKEYDNGYHFPPKYTAKDSFRHGAIAFWRFTITPVGFLVVLYGLNIVAWGGMLFLLLCGAAPAMCHPDCNDINSPRRKWVEVDSQILNALFCVTGFGLCPWRFRDFYYLLKWRIGKDELALRRLAGLYRTWVRLPGSEKLPIEVGPHNIPPDTPASCLPFPVTKIPDAPLTGQRAPPTAFWRIDFVIYMNIANTGFQCILCGFMWGMNRYDRPSWSTGLFVALGCICGAIGGLGSFFEGKRIKAIEGVPLSDEDIQKLSQDREMGILHYNNLKGKKPKETVNDADVEANAGLKGHHPHLHHHKKPEPETVT